MALISLSGLKENHWQKLSEDEGTELPESGQVLVSLSQAKQWQERLLAESGRWGLWIDNTLESVDQVKPWLDHAAQISIGFPASSDGRGFSLGVELRNQGYRGVLRASGELIPDQFPLALDCGFNEVEISEARLARQPLHHWLDAATSITGRYQLDYHTLSGNQPMVSIWSRRALA